MGPYVRQCSGSSPDVVRERGIELLLRPLEILLRLREFAGLAGDRLLPMFFLTFFLTFFELLANFWQTLRGPFSAVSTPIFAVKYSLE